MAEPVRVRCPACLREHVYTPAVLPCACGAPVAPPLLRGVEAEPVSDRTWAEDWVTLRCPMCGRRDRWPRPELGCDCGTLLRVPVQSDQAPAPSHIPLPRTAPAPRPAFQPVAIRTARDAVTAAALYLRWLGYRDVRRADQRPVSGIGLAAQGVVAQIEPSVRPATVRDVECLWLQSMTESAASVFFSLAGYADAARTRADELGVPLFVLDLAGVPQPVNSPADELIASGA
ncbi:hypothetical protein OKJ48_06990 [Streptomyces kunmingensis]|uniref:Restriction endonuclease type IV Mrr domain-containing protein n=1 Tax=Streptomyces kunmingensis TaxID=68225 RepID=A0ABU6C5V2_9ACTN|nr:hypothetical protein [Streptomyces kunmingensis]MEB3959997.1 hypothetical protein [Streptomyces kunmingensis]